MRHAVAAAAVALVLGGLLAVPAPAQNTPAGPLNITLPADWQARYIRYGALDRPDRRIIRQLYANPEAYFDARPGDALPQGLILVMADFPARAAPDGTLLRDIAGRLIPGPVPTRIAVQEKREGWGAAYPPDLRNGNWEYALFRGDLTRPDNATAPDSMRSCFACHIQQRPAEDFAYDFWNHVQSRTR
jgi:hypothetical protein